MQAKKKKSNEEKEKTASIPLTHTVVLGYKYSVLGWFPVSHFSLIQMFYSSSILLILNEQLLCLLAEVTFSSVELRRIFHSFTYMGFQIYTTLTLTVEYVLFCINLLELLIPMWYQVWEQLPHRQRHQCCSFISVVCNSLVSLLCHHGKGLRT